MATDNFFCLFGDTKLNLLTYFTEMESKYSAEYAEHQTILGKSKLQFTGEKLDEISAKASFHIQLCDPAEEILLLKKIMRSHEARSLTMKNGDFLGMFVLTDLSVSTKNTTSDGTVIYAEVSLSFKEYEEKKPNPNEKPKAKPVAKKAVDKKPAQAVKRKPTPRPKTPEYGACRG